MTKLMFLAWGDPAALRDEKLRDALAAAGATRLQLNTSDEHVASGMRLTTYAEPVTSIISVWTDADSAAAGPIADLLVGAAPRLVGWEVEERLPIPPADDQVRGERLDALANLALLRIPEELSREEWLDIWLVDHTPVGIATQGTFGYVQNITGDPVIDTTETPTPPGHPAALVEEHFPISALTDIHAFYGSGGDKAELDRRMTVMMQSVARFGADRDIDLVPTSRYVWDLVTPSPGSR